MKITNTTRSSSSARVSVRLVSRRSQSSAGLPAKFCTSSEPWCSRYKDFGDPQGVCQGRSTTPFCFIRFI